MAIDLSAQSLCNLTFCFHITLCGLLHCMLCVQAQTSKLYFTSSVCVTDRLAKCPQWAIKNKPMNDFRVFNLLRHSCCIRLFILSLSLPYIVHTKSFFCLQTHTHTLISYLLNSLLETYIDKMKFVSFYKGQMEKAHQYLYCGLLRHPFRLR